MHDNDMAKRLNKELEDKISMIQEKQNEYMAKIFTQETEIEKLQLKYDKSLSEKDGMVKE